MNKENQEKKPFREIVPGDLYKVVYNNVHYRNLMSNGQVVLSGIVPVCTVLLALTGVRKISFHFRGPWGFDDGRTMRPESPESIDYYGMSVAFLYKGKVIEIISEGIWESKKGFFDRIVPSDENKTVEFVCKKLYKNIKHVAT